MIIQIKVYNNYASDKIFIILCNNLFFNRKLYYYFLNILSENEMLYQFVTDQL